MATKQTIILKEDGSVKLKNLGKYIQKGNNLVDVIEIGIDTNNVISGLTATANFELPNGDTNTLTGVYSSTITDFDGNTYNGFVFTLTQAQTLYEGLVNMSIQLTDTSVPPQVLYSYSLVLTINPAVMTPSEQMISQAQWNSLVNTLGQYQIRYILENVRYYLGLANYVADLSNLTNGQLSLLKDGEKIKIVAKDTSTQLGYVILYCDMADKAFKDESGNNIKASYGASIEFSNLSKTATANVIPLVLYNKNGVSLSTNAFSLVSATSSLAGLMSATDKVKLDQLTGTPLIYKGSVATYDDLPTLISEPTMVSGWVYNTLDTGENYASVVVGTSLSWDKFGGDLSQFIKKDGSVAMTGDFNAGGHNLDDVDEVYSNTINTESLDNVNGEPIEVLQDLDMMSSSLIKNLPNATSNDEAVNLGQMNTALASYRTSANQDVIDQEIRELANGRTATYGLSYSSTIAKLKQALSNGFISKVYDSNDTDITQAVINGDYDSVSLVNSIFNDNDLRIYTTTAEGNWLLLGYIDVSQPVSVPTTTKLDTIANFKLKWKTNDEINVYERLVPDRWINIGAGNVIEFFANETKTVDLTNVAKKNETNTFSAVQTFSSGVNTEVINTSSTGSGNIYFRKDGSTLFYMTANAFIPLRNQDIGSSSTLAKDLYLSGIITDGTYSTTPANIYGNITTTSADSVSTTFSGSLTSNTDYKFSVLTSIAISSLMIKPNDQAPSWKMGFTVGTGLTCTLPSGCSWAGGTPDFTTMVGEYHFILIETTSTNNTYLAYLI